MVSTVKCPTCHTSVQWQPESRYRPFCSERCRLIDLGEWAQEKNVIASTPQTAEEWDALYHE